MKYKIAYTANCRSLEASGWRVLCCFPRFWLTSFVVQLILYSYWRSSAAWRVRIGLNLKELQYEYKGTSATHRLCVLAFFAC